MEVRISRARAHVRTPGIGKLDIVLVVLGSLVAASAREMGLSFGKALLLGGADYLAKKQNPLLGGTTQTKLGTDTYDRFRPGPSYDSHATYNRQTTEHFPGF